MVKEGERVQTLTKVVGQSPREGVVIAVQEGSEFLEVEWDDGHTSTVSMGAIVPVSSIGNDKRRS